MGRTVEAEGQTVVGLLAGFYKPCTVMRETMTVSLKMYDFRNLLFYSVTSFPG